VPLFKHLALGSFGWHREERADDDVVRVLFSRRAEEVLRIAPIMGRLKLASFGMLPQLQRFSFEPSTRKHSTCESRC
jgi:hypothetical protein